MAQKPDDLEALKRLHAMLDIADALPTPVNLWEVQNLCFAPLSQGATGNGNGNWHGSGANGESSGQEWYRERGRCARTASYSR